MTDKQDEWLSQCFDGEGTDFEQRRAVDRIAESSECKEKLDRYQLIRDAMQSQLADSIPNDFSASLKQKLDNDVDAVHIESTQQSASSSGTSSPRWLRPFSGVAIAATVAAVAILATNPQNNDDGYISGTSAEIAAVQPAISNPVMQVSAQTVGAGSAPKLKFRSIVPQGEMMSVVGPDYNRNWEQLDPTLKQALSRYIMDHHSGQYEQPVANMIPSVRLVGFDEVQ